MTSINVQASWVLVHLTMLDVDILWRSVGNMNATSIKNFHTLTYDLEETEAEETIIGGSSTGQLHNTLDNNLNPHSVKKNHDDKEKRQPNYRPSSTEESKQNFTTELVNKSNEGQWNLIKVRVGFDVTRKGRFCGFFTCHMLSRCYNIRSNFTTNGLYL